jgi:hypothetical protein
VTLQSVPCSITGALTLMQIVAPTNQKVVIDRIMISGQSNLNTDTPVALEILEQTTAGTATNTTVAPVKANVLDTETVQTNTQNTFTVEPTAGLSHFARNIHPQGSYDFNFPPGREIVLGGGKKLAIRQPVAAVQASKFTITVEGRE